MRSTAGSTSFLYSLLVARPMPRLDASFDPPDDDHGRGSRRPARRGWSFCDSQAAIETARHRAEELDGSHRAAP